MSPEDGNQSGLRVGGWIPPIQHFAPPERKPDETLALTVVSVPAIRSPRGAPPAPVRTVLVTAAVLSVLVAGGLALAPQDERPVTPEFVALPSVPALPAVAAEPSAAGPQSPPIPTTGLVTSDLSQPLRPAPGGPTRATGAATGTAGSVSFPSRTASPGPSPSPSPSRAALPVVGALIGLEPVGEPGRRVRHRNFQARVDALGPGSSATDRADSRFTVRAGRAGSSCVSFESTNYPGYFLRHRNYVLRLDRVDGSALFDADATFCPVDVATGGFVLRSVNYPDRYLTESDSLLLLTRTTPAAAAAFVTRSPL